MNNRLYPTQPQLAVGAVVFNENKVLLVHRRNPPGQGVWAIPGGRVRLGETLQQAAEREIFEETGVVIGAKEPIFTFDMIDRDKTGRPRYHYVIIDLRATYLSGRLVAGDDARAAKWVSEKELATLNVNETTLRLLYDRFRFGRQPVASQTLPLPPNQKSVPTE